jgi:phytoene dehydrogenase-like protein
MTTDRQYDAIIVGGGHNGLVCAHYLARAGKQVLVLERRDFVGGAVVTEELWPGYSVPTCSYVCYVLQPQIIDDMRLRDYGFRVHQMDPTYFVPFPDGRRILGWRDDAAFLQEIARFSERDAAALPRFQELERRMASLIHRWIMKPAPSYDEMLEDARQSGDADLLERMFTGSLAGFIEEHFESPEVQGFFAMAWDAGDPDAPGSLLSAMFPVISQFTRPEDYGIVAGGMGTITQAMARSVMADGVEIRTSAEVEQILVDDTGANGVRMVDGQEIRADLVISNADPKRTFLQLLPDDALDSTFTERVRNLKTDAAYLKFHAALDDLPDFSRYFDGDYDPQYLAYTNIRPSLQAARKSWRDASSGKVTDSPLLSIQIPTVHDRTLVPNGGHVMSIWVQYAPVNPVDGPWEDLRESTGEALIDVIQQYAPNIRDVIRDWTLYTPKDIEQRVGLTDGNIRHIDMIAGQVFDQRPLPGYADYTTPIDRLYLCGAGTHGGGEVTGAPGYNAANSILSRQAVAGTLR